MTTGLLQGKRGIITDIANNMSISWAIAQLARKHGAELCFTYQSEIFEKRVKPLAEEVGCNFVSELDVTNPKSITVLLSYYGAEKVIPNYNNYSNIKLLRC